MSVPKVRLLMDSGAVSAYYLGAEIKIDDYAKFVLDNEKHIWTAINLDVLDIKNPVRAAEESWVNFNYLLDKGIMTLPVFHEREEVKWLDKMLDVTSYIGLSSHVSTGPGVQKDHRAWYHLVWNHITDSKGRAIAKFHGFGDTAPSSLQTFPWATVDSTTWYLSGARAGTIILDGRRYQARSKVIRGRHFLDLNSPSPQKEGWASKIASWGLNSEIFMGETLTSDEMNIFRCYCTAAYIKELVEQSAGVTTYQAPESLITPRSIKEGTERAGPVQAFFVLSGSTAKRAMPILTKLGITDALISYHYTTPRVWEQDILPWLYDPEGTCKTNPRLKPYWDLLERFSEETVCK